MALEIKASLPITIREIFNDKDWAGGRILQLDSEISRPGADDVLTNYHFLLPFVRRFNDRVPSAFYCTDVWLYFDRLYLGQVLRGEGATKQAMAAQEGMAMKRLIGGLRYLWRSSALHARHDNISYNIYIRYSKIRYYSIIYIYIYVYLLLYHIIISLLRLFLHVTYGSGSHAEAKAKETTQESQS